MEVSLVSQTVLAGGMPAYLSDVCSVRVHHCFRAFPPAVVACFYFQDACLYVLSTVGLSGTACGFSHEILTEPLKSLLQRSQVISQDWEI